MKIEIPEQKTLAHEMIIPIRWGDMDAMGHLNNTVYFRYMETARIDWFTELGFAPNPKGEGVVIVNAFCNFIQQFKYPGQVRMKTFVSNVGRSSFDTWVIMEPADQAGAVYANGGATVVWIDMTAQKSAPLPPWLRQRLAA